MCFSLVYEFTIVIVFSFYITFLTQNAFYTNLQNIVFLNNISLTVNKYDFINIMKNRDYQKEVKKLHVFLQLSYTHLPPAMVRSIGIVIKVEGSSLNGLRPNTTRSASFPASKDPLLFSSYEA